MCSRILGGLEDKPNVFHGGVGDDLGGGTKLGEAHFYAAYIYGWVKGLLQRGG